jgi:hypothetical protein
MPEDAVPPPLMATQLLQVRPMVHADADDHELAEAAFREPLALLRSIEAPFMRGRCLCAVAALLLRSGRA